MIKLMIASRRRAGMSRQEYHRYYQKVHAAKILAGPPELLADMNRYVQNEVLDGVYGVPATKLLPLADFDSVSEITFPDPAAASRSVEYPYYRTVIQPDEPNFADETSLVVMMVAEEGEAVPRPRNGELKVMHFLHAAPGVDRPDFFAAWRDRSARMLQSSGLSDRIGRYVRNHALPVPANASGDNFGGTPVNVYGGVANLWFDRLDDRSGVRDYLTAFEQAFPPGDSVVDHERSFVLIARDLRALPIAD